MEILTHIAKFIGPTWGPPGSCRPQLGPMLAPWTLLSGKCIYAWSNSNPLLLFAIATRYDIKSQYSWAPGRCVVVSNVQISNTSMILIWVFNWTLPWKEYQRISLMVSQHTLRWWLGTIRLQAITCPRVGQDLCYYIVWLSCNKLKNNWLDSIWFALSLIKWFFFCITVPKPFIFSQNCSMLWIGEYRREMCKLALADDLQWDIF